MAGLGMASEASIPNNTFQLQQKDSQIIIQNAVAWEDMIPLGDENEHKQEKGK